MKRNNFFEEKYAIPPIQRGEEPYLPGEPYTPVPTPPPTTDTSSNITIWLLIGVILFILWKN